MPGMAKQLRLGLVCYGGSSLAIYMHGITKEIHRLARASAIRSAGGTPDRPSEQRYAELLDRLSPADGDAPDLRVIVDVISGTSAGGINGIYLAKALVGNRPLDALRDLWFDRGDMNELAVGPRKVGRDLPIRVNAGPIHINRRIKAWPISWKAKLPMLLLRAPKWEPLRGDDMSRWLYEALETMDRATPQPPSLTSLLPRAHPLDLFVTITDFYGYRRKIPLSRPPFVTDVRHRHALDFHFELPGTNDFGDNPGLAFAARTTSCFPGVFPPVRPSKFGTVIGAGMDTFVNRCFRIYTLSDAEPNETYFIDGGVLDNKPFGWAIDTIIHKRPAESEVDRRLLYIEPDPAKAEGRQGGDRPDPLAVVAGAMSTIPRDEPILDELLGVQAHNELVERVRDVVEANFARVAVRVRSIRDLEHDLRYKPPESWPWPDWNDEVHDLSIAEAGMTYATYLRLKISSVLDGLASSICSVCDYPDESNQALLVRETVRAWGRQNDLFENVARDAEGEPCREDDEDVELPEFRPTPGQTQFLQSFDLGYMRRRLRFLVAGVNWWYRCVGEPNFPDRPELDSAKAIIYQTIGTLNALAELRIGEDSDEDARQQVHALHQQIESVFAEDQLKAFLANPGPDGTKYADKRAADLTGLFTAAQAFLNEQLKNFVPALLAQLVQHPVLSNDQRRRDLVVRYLGFPIWDVLLYPVQALSQVGEGDHINVTRISPYEANVLPTRPDDKVKGKRLGHFYAFFHREARENDYLWGRLDAAEELIQLVFQAAGNPDAEEDIRLACQQSFDAVLDEETNALTTIQNQVSDLRDEVAQLTRENR